ncbi:MAG: hypothetical protein LUD46_11345 [Parabacteroides sp.]|nr:hypothetical protein [Parabacteroides sp.]
MSLSGEYLIVSVVLFIVLLPGCSAGRQSSVQRETVTETLAMRTDSLLLHDLFQASGNKTIDIEHIVFQTVRSDTLCADSCRTATLPSIRSVTRIAIDEQGKIESKTSARSGSVSESRSTGFDSLQKEHIANFSLGRWMFVLLIIGFLLFWIRSK